jgi:uncharacterized Ntn-hydrolase superfamily protein
MSGRLPFAHTFSIVARDASTGQLGVAVQSHWFSVGGTVAWAAAGVGAVATQAFAEVTYGPRGLEALRAGTEPAEALKAMLAADPSRELRQVGLVDSQGRAAAHTGSRCMVHAGHIVGTGFTVQANMMRGAGVWPAMAEVYTRTEGDLAERLLRALEAGEAAGGDVRGRQSAALLVVGGPTPAHAGLDRIFDLRVEDHPEPIAELRRLAGIQRAYISMNEGDAQLAAGLTGEALASYARARALAPAIGEIAFWTAVTLADTGRIDEALPIFSEVFAAEPQWKEVLRRLPATGMSHLTPGALERILRVRA